jgi:hypothetical protein
MLLTCKHPPVHEFSQFGNPNENGKAESSGLIILQATGAKAQSQLSSLKQSGEKRKEGNSQNN